MSDTRNSIFNNQNNPELIFSGNNSRDMYTVDLQSNQSNQRLNERVNNVDSIARGNTQGLEQLNGKLTQVRNSAQNNATNLKQVSGRTEQNYQNLRSVENKANNNSLNIGKNEKNISLLEGKIEGFYKMFTNQLGYIKNYVDTKLPETGTKLTEVSNVVKSNIESGVAKVQSMDMTTIIIMVVIILLCVSIIIIRINLNSQKSETNEERIDKIENKIEDNNQRTVIISPPPREDNQTNTSLESNNMYIFMFVSVVTIAFIYYTSVPAPPTTGRRRK